jgi:hypothetical protein
VLHVVNPNGTAALEAGGEGKCGLSSQKRANGYNLFTKIRHFVQENIEKAMLDRE